MNRPSFTLPVIGVAVAAIAFYASSGLSTTGTIQAPAPTVVGVSCEKSFDRIEAQRRLMQDPALISSNPDATDTRVTPVEWMMLTPWQRQTIAAQNSNLPGNASSCQENTVSDAVARYTTP